MVGLYQAEETEVITDNILEKPQTLILEQFFSKEFVLKIVPSCITVQNPKNNLKWI